MSAQADVIRRRKSPRAYARRLGRRAYLDGRTLTDNPYPHAAPGHRSAWREGFLLELRADKEKR